MSREREEENAASQRREAGAAGGWCPSEVLWVWEGCVPWQCKALTQPLSVPFCDTCELLKPKRGDLWEGFNCRIKITARLGWKDPYSLPSTNPCPGLVAHHQGSMQPDFGHLRVRGSQEGDQCPRCSGVLGSDTACTRGMSLAGIGLGCDTFPFL